jgi:hypothetical protein
MEVKMSDLMSGIEESFSEFQFAETESDVNEQDAEESKTTEKDPVEKETDNPEEKSTEEEATAKESKEDEQEEPTEPKKPNRIQRRINGFKRHISERDAKIKALEEEKAALLRKYGQIDESGLPVEPDPRRYRSERAYRDAHIRWQNEVKQTKADKETQAQIEFENTAKAFQKKLATDKLKWADYDKVVTDELLDIPMRPSVTKAIANMDNGPDVIYALGKNPEVLLEISNMPEWRALAYIGKISAQMERFVAKNRNKNKITKANEPPSTVKGNTPPKVDLINDDAAFDKHMKGIESG